MSYTNEQFELAKKLLDTSKVKLLEIILNQGTKIEALEKASQWQPIKTAPKETEVFIGRFIAGEFEFGRSELFYEQANEFAGETFSGWVWSEDECSSSIAEQPTHWMSLPKPPVAGEVT